MHSLRSGRWVNQRRGLDDPCRRKSAPQTGECYLSIGSSLELTQMKTVAITSVLHPVRIVKAMILELRQIRQIVLSKWRHRRAQRDKKPADLIVSAIGRFDLTVTVFSRNLGSRIDCPACWHCHTPRNGLTNWFLTTAGRASQPKLAQACAHTHRAGMTER